MAPSPHPSSAFHKAACATSASWLHRRKLFSTCPWPAFPRACFWWDCFPPPSSPRGWALDHFRAQCPFPRQQTLKPFPRKAAGSCSKPADPEAFSKAAGSSSKAADPEAFSKAAGFLEQPAPFTNFTLALGAMALQKLSTLSTLACAAEPKHYQKKSMHAACEHVCKARCIHPLAKLLDFLQALQKHLESGRKAMLKTTGIRIETFPKASGETTLAFPKAFSNPFWHRASPSWQLPLLLSSDPFPRLL